jgi:hypothetical protein
VRRARKQDWQANLCEEGANWRADTIIAVLFGLGSLTPEAANPKILPPIQQADEIEATQTGM